MMLFKRALPTLSALILIGLLEGLMVQKQLFWPLVPLLLFLAGASAGHLAQWRFSSTEFWHFTLAPFTLVAAALFLLVFLSTPLTIQALILGTGVVLWWYLENLYLFLYQPSSYQPYALENISAYLTIMVTFFFYTGLVAARVFLNVSLLLLFPMGVLMTAFTAVRLLWGMKILFSRGWVLMVVYTLIMAELLLAVLLLPTSTFVSGLLMTIPHYLMMNIARYALRGELSTRVVRRYALIGSAVLAVTLVTAPWT